MCLCKAQKQYSNKRLYKIAGIFLKNDLKGNKMSVGAKSKLDAGVDNVTPTVVGVFSGNSLTLSLMLVRSVAGILTPFGLTRGAYSLLGNGSRRQSLNLWQSLNSRLRRGIGRGGRGDGYRTYLQGNAPRFHVQTTGTTIPQLLHDRNEESVNPSMIYYILDIFEISRVSAVRMQIEGA